MRRPSVCSAATFGESVDVSPPRPQHERRVAVDVDEESGRVVRCRLAAVAAGVRRIHRSVAQIGKETARAMAVGVADTGDIAHQVLRLGLGAGRRSAICLAADVAVRALAMRDIPVEREIAVEVDAVAVGVDGGIAVAVAVDLIHILAPVDLLLRFLAASGFACSTRRKSA